MTSSLFAGIDAIYGYSLASRVEYHPAESASFQKFWEASRRFERAAGVTASEDIVRPLLRASRARFPAAAAPLPFCQLPFFRRPQDAEVIVHRVCNVYPSMALQARELAALIRELSASLANPLLERLENLRAERGIESATIVVRAGKLVEPCRDLIGSRLGFGFWDVVDPDHLRDPRTYERLVLIGPTGPGWFPDYVLAAPRAPELHVISYAWLLRPWCRQPLLVGGAAPEEREPTTERHTHPSPEPLESWPEPDWSEIERRALEDSGPPGHHGHDVTEARLFLLGHGLAVFLDVSHRSTSLVIDPDADADARVRRVLSDEIEAGTLLLRRTEGGGDYVVPLADQILGGRARDYRGMQTEWKRRLREAVDASPEGDVRSRLIDISLRLLGLGAQCADETNLRYWMSPRSICTRDRRDYHAVLTLVGLASEFDRYWSVMRQILTAHHRAGRRIRRKLIERVREVAQSDLVGRKRIDFALPEEEGGRLTAFLVERRSPERTTILSSREGCIFEREEW